MVSTWVRRATRVPRGLWALVGCGALVAACGGGDTTAPGPTQTSVTTSTTSAGGGGAGGSGTTTTTTTTTSTGGGGAGGGAGGAVGYAIGASDVVNGGDAAESPMFKMKHSLGQPSQHQGTMTSPTYRLQGGLVGAMETSP